MMRMRRALTRGVIAVLALAVLAVPVTAAGAAGVATDVDDFSFASLDADYTLDRTSEGTSTLRVVETFTAVFPESDQNRGMARVIPETYNGQPVNPRLISLTDEDGNPRPAETASEDGSFSMTSRASDYVRGTQTYVFTYELENVTWNFPDTGEEFYWDVNGVDWAQPFGRITARLHMSAELADALAGRQACYVGYQGSTDTCPIASSGSGPDTVIEASATGVQPNQTMTIAVGFEAGSFTFYDTGFLASHWGWLQAIAGLGMIGSLVAAVVVRRRRLRDDPGRATIIAEYAPPPGMDALESAILLGNPTKAIPAEVLEQAVVGSIRIVEGETKWWGGRAPLQAHLLDRSRADGDGRMLLDGLFGPNAPAGTVFEFGRQDSRFSSKAQQILKAATAELERRGLRRPVSGWTRAWPILIAIGAGALVALFGALALGAYVNALVPVLLIVAIFPVVFTVIGLVARKPLTAAGAEVRDHLEGLKVFIEWAEADRIRMLQSPAGAERVPVDVNDPRQMLKLYETLLPYAVVFGQEKQWAAQLAVLYAGATPYWYYGTGGFDASSFSSGIGTLSSSASSSSSTSGGSSGGGSAGGGGGGGGGGGV